jgi:hypothetical protein
MRLRIALRGARARSASGVGSGLVRIAATLGLLATITYALSSDAIPLTTPSAHEQLDELEMLGIGCGDPSEEGVIIRISKTQIVVGEESTVVAQYADAKKLPESRLAPKSKGGGTEGVPIQPLADVLAKYRNVDKQIREAKGEPSDTSEAIIIADETTPYGLFSEVVDTCQKSEFGKFHVMARIGTKK